MAFLKTQYNKLGIKKGYHIYATGGTSTFLTNNGIENTRVYWPSENEKPQAIDLLHEHRIDMVVNIPKNLSSGELTNGYRIRRAAIDLNIPLITNARLASAFIHAFCTINMDELAIKSWNEDIYHNKHQDKCLYQRLDYFMDRSEQEVIGILGDIDIQTCRQ